MTWRANFLVVQLNGFMSLMSYFDVMHIIHIKETIYSCQFKYIFGNQQVKVSNFSGHDLRNCSTLGIGVLSYIIIL
jgi:hypothetical protein